MISRDSRLKSQNDLDVDDKPFVMALQDNMDSARIASDKQVLKSELDLNIPLGDMMENREGSEMLVIRSTVVKK